jgi:hypothetical protein
MVTRRDMGVSFAPAKRAAVWPRPSREPGRWPVPCRQLRTAHRRLAAAGFACLLEHLGNEALPWPLPRFFGALGRTRKSSSRRSVMAALPASSGVSCRAKHADMPALARPSRPTRHGGEAAPCRATPTCRQGFRRGPVPRPFVLPSAFALRCRSGHRRPGGAAAACSQRAGERANGRRPGAFEARRLHVGRLRRMQRDVRCECTRTARATTRQQPAERHARWHDERHGKRSESAAIMGVSPARPDARRRSRRMR